MNDIYELVDIVIFLAALTGMLVYMFVHKLVYKRRLARRLGRSVEDRELTSLAAWMEEPPAGRGGRR